MISWYWIKNWVTFFVAVKRKNYVVLRLPLPSSWARSEYDWQGNINPSDHRVRSVLTDFVSLPRPFNCIWKSNAFQTADTSYIPKRNFLLWPFPMKRDWRCTSLKNWMRFINKENLSGCLRYLIAVTMTETSVHGLEEMNRVIRAGSEHMI